MIKRMVITLFFVLLPLCGLWGQKGPGRGAGNDDEIADRWQVSVNEMDNARREKITQVVEALQEQDGSTRSVAALMLTAAGSAAVTALVDVTATEIVRLFNYRKTQKREWMQMIERECNYTDSLSSIRGLQDFYTDVSRYGALDPSNMNFDGISIRGIREGHEVLYLSCHIDDSRLDHLFQHSKFYLVVDTIAFHPYECHLPNLGANGIHLRRGEATERNNRFSYDEREHLTIGMEIILSSSWINEAAFVQSDVELGRFIMNVTIPNDTEVYTYSRAQIDRNRERVRTTPGTRLDTTYVQMLGDCFVVPRSYMPISGEQRMWGTGEYAMKVKFRESCQFSSDATRNQKLKHWKRDYRQLRAMQKKGSAFTQYFRTLWQQNGNNLVKTMVKAGLNTGASQAGLTGGSAARSSGAAAASTGNAASGAPAGGAEIPAGGGK